MGIADLMLPDYAGNAMTAFSNAQDRAKQSSLAKMLGTAMNDPSQRQDALGRAAMIDPGAAFAFRSKLTDESLEDLARDAGMFTELARSGDEAAIQSAYAPLVQKARAALGAPLPTTYDPRFLPAIEKLASFGGASSQMPAGYQTTDMILRGAGFQPGTPEYQRGMRIEAGLEPGFGKSAPRTLTVDINGVPTQVTFDPTTQRYIPATLGGQPQSMQRGGTQFAGPDGMPVNIDPSLPPEVQQSIRSNIGAYNALPDGASAQIGLPGVPIVGRPKEQQAFLEEQAKQEAQLGALPRRSQIEAEGAGLKATAEAQARAQVEREVSEPKRQEKVRLATVGIQNTIDAIDAALKDVDWTTAGPLGALSQDIPGTPAYALAKTALTIKANIGFDRLQQMRDASPTGGALGQVAVQELDALQASIASLDQGLPPAQLAANLEKVKHHYEAWLDAVTQADQAARGRVGGPPASGGGNYRHLWGGN